MALDTFVAGRYAGTWNSVDVGITQTGYEVQQESSAEMINQTDAFGDSVVDWVYRGGNCFLQFESKAWKSGSISPFWPWGGGTLGVMANTAAPIGTLASALAKTMVLTPTANTPAAAANVVAAATFTATLSLLAPNSPARLLFDSRVRNVPVRLQLLPALSSGTYSWFS